MKVLMVGDVIGKPGRKLVSALLRDLRTREKIDFVIANGENASGGAGLVESSADELYEAGVNVITGGNHLFKNPAVLNFIDREPRLVRPANYPPHPRARGEGCRVFNLPGGVRLAVINLLGTVLMREMDNPFHCVDAILEKLADVTPNIFVDFHAEISSEKVALGWHLDGRVTAVFGTHTHVPTADARLLNHGTAHQTDVGMTGPYDSILGVRKDIILEGFLSKMPVRHELAKDNLQLRGAIVEFDPETGRASGIQSVHETA